MATAVLQPTMETAFPEMEKPELQKETLREDTLKRDVLSTETDTTASEEDDPHASLTGAMKKRGFTTKLLTPFSSALGAAMERSGQLPPEMVKIIKTRMSGDDIKLMQETTGPVSKELRALAPRELIQRFQRAFSMEVVRRGGYEDPADAPLSLIHI